MDDAVDGSKDKEIKDEVCISEFCDICKEDNNNEEAVGFCAKCGQYLCAVCKQYHLRVATTKSHTILGVNDLPTPRSENEESICSEGYNPPTCKIHQDLEIEFYCEEHDEAICKTCKIVEHRKCTNIESLQKAASLNSYECTELTEYVKYIEKTFANIKSVKQNEKAELFNEKKKAADAVLEKRKEYDRLEQKALNEIDDIFEIEVKHIDKAMEIIELSQPLVSSTITKFENIIKFGTVEEKFLAMKSALNDVKKYEEILHDTKSVSTRTINFTDNHKLSNMDSLGKIMVVEESNDFEMDVQDIIFTERPSDKNTNFITSMKILSNERHLLLDSDNMKLKLFSESTVFLSELTLPYTPNGMEVLNDKEIVVALPYKGDQSLQVINIDNDIMTLGRCLPTTLSHCCVTKYSYTELLTLSNDVFGQFYMQIIDHNGNVLKGSQLTTQRLTHPFNVSHISDKTRDLVYVVDYNNGCIVMTLDGEVVSHYKDDNYDVYRGLAIDGEGCVYIGCGSETSPQRNVLKLSPAGKKIKLLFHKDNKIGVIPLHYKGNKMFVRKKTDDTRCVACVYNNLM